MFLILFCYVILVRLPVTPPPQEIILIIFVFTLFTEEVRQVCTNVTFFIYFPITSNVWHVCIVRCSASFESSSRDRFLGLYYSTHRSTKTFLFLENFL